MRGQIAHSSNYGVLREFSKITFQLPQNFRSYLGYQVNTTLKNDGKNQKYFASLYSWLEEGPNGLFNSWSTSKFIVSTIDTLIASTTSKKFNERETQKGGEN